MNWRRLVCLVFGHVPIEYTHYTECARCYKIWWIGEAQ